MENKAYWFITVFETAEIDNLGWPKTGCTRCWGFYSNKQDALNALHGNYTDMWEYCYDYAILEAYYEGIGGYSFNEERQFFKYDKEQDGYFEIEAPQGFEHICSFAIG